MFDRFYKIQQYESHGDIIIWPLKAICDYMEATSDFDFFNEELSYTDEDDFEGPYMKIPFWLYFLIIGLLYLLYLLLTPLLLR